VWHNHAPFIRKLVTQGADVTVQNQKGDTALHLACEKGHMAVARLLVEAGASIGVRNAAHKRCWEVVSDKLPDHLEMVEDIKRMPVERRNRIASSRHFGPELCRKFVNIVDFFNYEKYRRIWRRREGRELRRERTVFENLAREAKRHKQALKDLKKRNPGAEDYEAALDEDNAEAEETKLDRARTHASERSDEDESDEEPDPGLLHFSTDAIYTKHCSRLLCYCRDRPHSNIYFPLVV
jgi:hypothetical protein